MKAPYSIGKIHIKRKSNPPICSCCSKPATLEVLFDEGKYTLLVRYCNECFKEEVNQIEPDVNSNNSQELAMVTSA